MIFDPASGPHLKPWLVRTLEPICDAEPGALADYILALLKHNVPESEMRKELQVQLEEFLENECKGFIDTLFTVLRTKSYLPYSTNPPTPPPSGSQDEEGISIPVDEIMGAGPSHGRKRSMADGERDGRPAKGARLNAEGDFSRYGNGTWAPPQMPQMGMNPMAMGMGMGLMNGRRQQGVYQPPGAKKGICRDYHHHGYCARGDTCKYSHGEDAVIPPPLYPMGAPMMPFNYLYNMFNPTAPYDPNDSRLDVRNAGGRQPRAPTIPRDNGGAALSGELPVIQDLTPKPDGAPQQEQQQEQQAQQPPQQMPMQPNPMGMMAGFDPTMFGVPLMGADMPGPGPSGHNGGNGNNFRGRGGGPGRGRGGGFASEANNFRPGRRGDKTIVVEKIPEDKLSLEQISGWFKKFGEVTNVAVDPRGGKALVSFATHEEARAAWKSEDAVFNNRFVKVFWHKPMEGHGQVGQRALAASATLVANLAAKESSAGSSSTVTTTTATAAPSVKKSGSQSATAAALAAKQELLEKQIGEQKALMEELGTATPERKREIMARLRKLNEEMTAAKKAEVVAPQKEATLDKDSEMKAPEESATGGEETTEQLKAKLERLKAEAASLGIAESGEGYGAGGYRGGYRGRGRGRGTFYRGGPPVMRGGPPRGSLKLDNRPKKLVVKGLKDSDTQHVKEWYEALGQVDNFETLDGGDVLVSFRTRAAAEQGLAKGTHIPGVGKVQVTWHTGKPATTSVAPAASMSTSSSTDAASSSMPVDKDAEDTSTPPREASPAGSFHEEEALISGWGGEEDGMGMM